MPGAVAEEAVSVLMCSGSGAITGFQYFAYHCGRVRRGAFPDGSDGWDRDMAPSCDRSCRPSAVGREIHGHRLGRDEQRGTPTGQRELVLVRVVAVMREDRPEQAVVGVVDVVAPARFRSTRWQVRVWTGLPLTASKDIKTQVRAVFPSIDAARGAVSLCSSRGLVDAARMRVWAALWKSPYGGAAVGAGPD